MFHLLVTDGNGNMVFFFFIIKCRPGRESDSDPEDLEHAEKLRQVKAVLEEVLLVLSLFCCALII